MLKIEITDNDCKVVHQGSPVDTAVDVATAVSSIYTALWTSSNLAAEVFRSAIVTALGSGSPVWARNEKQTTIIISEEQIKKGGAPTDQS